MKSGSQHWDALLLGLNYLLAKKDSLFKLIAYTGPALIVSMAYMDPGNYGTDIQAGASLNYGLLWVVWLSSGMAMLLQYLSGKIGIATRLSLLEIISEKLRKKRKTYVILYWLATEVAVAATDLAEYLGTVIALNLLFGIPMIYSAIFGAVDVILILVLATQHRFRIIERLFALFVSIIGFGYLYEIFITKPNHALFVHSWLTKNKTQNKTLLQRRKLRKFHLIENVVLLIVAGMINSAIMIMAASAFHSYNPNIASISEAYRTLLPLFGSTAGIVFLVTLLSSGIASSVTGTLAGQAIMEGLLGKKVNIWFRRFVTRFVNVIPTTIAILLGLDPLNILVYSQVILSLMIPLPMIPLVILSADKILMNEFVNRRITTVVAIVFVGIILVFNSYLLISIK
jgi:manganese transport protein